MQHNARRAEATARADINEMWKKYPHPWMAVAMVTGHLEEGLDSKIFGSHSKSVDEVEFSLYDLVHEMEEEDASIRLGGVDEFADDDFDYNAYEDMHESYQEALWGEVCQGNESETIFGF